MANDCNPRYRPGQDITFQASGAITGKRFVIVTGRQVSFGALSSTADGGNLIAAQAGAGARADGVAKYDAASGDKCGMICLDGHAVPMTSGGAIAVGDLIASDAQGRAVTATSTAKVLGKAWSAVAGAGLDVLVKTRPDGFNALT